MNLPLLRLLCCTVLSSLCAASPAADAGPDVFPSYGDAAAVKARCDATLREVQAQTRRIAAGTGQGGVLIELDRLGQLVDDHLGPVFFLSNVHPTKAVRDAAEACELRYQAFTSRLYQNAKIYARLQRLRAGDAIDTQMRTDLLASFEDAGVGLPAQRRERARLLNNELGRLSQDFERRLREDNTRVAFTDSELDGVPAGVWAAAPRDPQGRVLLGLDYPTYSPVVEGARSPEARERIWRAFQARGGQPNLKTLARLGEKRRSYARLFGLASYADFTLRRRMAQRVDNVQAFLEEVKSALGQREERDLVELRAAKASELQTAPGATPLKRWDVPYYIERVKRERFALDQNSFRRYFPPQASVDFVFAVAGRLFGVGFKPLEQTLWHPDVKAYAVVDAASQRTLATLYLDLYPRPGKYGHAAVWPLRGSSTWSGQLPTAALVTNFDRQGLTLDELETLLHEFGHALHVTLSHTRYAAQAGTAVKLDFVEAPSQMLEEWVYDAQVLALFQQVCATCEPVPADLLERAVRSRSFAKGLQFARQHLYASYDLALHDKDAPEPMALWARMESATPLGYEPGSLFPAGFSHVAGGYGAGYYAYLWSLAIAQDLRTAFAANPLDAKVGQRYREAVLANGGQAPPAELVARFLGRAPNNAAFFEWLER
ncbi:M3 family metallopeptidase [Methylibium sp.]|uniref:M3 family metallopeptidase n=1 Tax=Methylibium sp. TaxID=2067992 RepID=UPI003D12A49D